MIIMIKDYEDGLQKWHMWDNIDRIIDEPTLKCGEAYKFPYVAANRYHIIVPANQIAREKGEELMMGRLICERRNSDSGFKIFYNTEAYICNDDGKTIKKIVIYPKELLT